MYLHFCGAQTSRGMTKGLDCFFSYVIPGPDPGTQVMRVKRQKYFDNFIAPVPACAGMTKNAVAGITIFVKKIRKTDLGPVVKPRDDKRKMYYNLGAKVKPRDDKREKIAIQ